MRWRPRMATAWRRSSSGCSISTATACPRTGSAPPSCSSRRPTRAMPPAQYNLALLHVEGRTPRPSLAEAARLMKAAADAGLRRGAVRLRHDADRRRRRRRPTRRKAPGRSGSRRSRGWSRPRSIMRRCSIWARASTRDLKAAVGWYERAANAGNAGGAEPLRQAARGGRGRRRSICTQAAMWRALARRQGLTDPRARQAAGRDFARRISTAPRSWRASGRPSRRPPRTWQRRKRAKRQRRRWSRPTSSPANRPDAHQSARRPLRFGRFCAR